MKTPKFFSKIVTFAAIQVQIESLDENQFYIQVEKEKQDEGFFNNFFF